MVVGHPLDGGLALLIELTYASSGVHPREKREKIKLYPALMQLMPMPILGGRWHPLHETLNMMLAKFNTTEVSNFNTRV